jgi:hypothetical protein
MPRPQLRHVECRRGWRTAGCSSAGEHLCGARFAHWTQAAAARPSDAALVRQLEEGVAELRKLCEEGKAIVGSK